MKNSRDRKNRIALGETLKNQEDPRGSFILNQLALCKTTSENEHSAIVRQLQQQPILQEWEVEIQQSGLNHWKNRPGWLFRRGDIEHVTTTAKFLLKNHKKLLSVAPISSILLMKVSNSEIARLGKQQWLRNISSMGLLISPSASLAPLLNSPYLENLKTLHLNWVSEELWNFPRDLGSKPISELIASPVLKQLRELRTSIAKAKDAEALVVALDEIVDFRMRSRKPFPQRQAKRIAKLMNLPKLQHFTAPNIMEPESCPGLKHVCFHRSSTEISENFANRLQSLSISMASAKAISKLGDSDSLTSLQVKAITSGPEQALIWNQLAKGKWHNLGSLGIHGFNLRRDQLSVLQNAEWLQRINCLDMKTSGRDIAVELVSHLNNLEELHISWSINNPAGLDIPAPKNLQRLAINGSYGDMKHLHPNWHTDSPGNICQAICKAELPKLELLSIAGVGNQPSLGPEGAKALLHAAPPSLKCLWARLGSLDKDLAQALLDRFVVYDGGIDGGPLAMTDWNWRGHSWHLETLDTTSM